MTNSACAQSWTKGWEKWYFTLKIQHAEGNDILQKWDYESQTPCRLWENSDFSQLLSNWVTNSACAQSWTKDWRKWCFSLKIQWVEGNHILFLKNKLRTPHKPLVYRKVRALLNYSDMERSLVVDYIVAKCVEKNHATRWKFNMWKEMIFFFRKMNCEPLKSRRVIGKFAGFPNTLIRNCHQFCADWIGNRVRAQFYSLYISLF